jgi:hypothetical protein
MALAPGLPGNDYTGPDLAGDGGFGWGCGKGWVRGDGDYTIAGYTLSTVPGTFYRD